MNDKGLVIAGSMALGTIILVVLGLILAALFFTFAKSLVIAVGLAVLGAFLLYKVANSFDKKSGQAIALISILIIFSSLFVGVTQPFSFTSTFGEAPYWRYETFFGPSLFSLSDSCNPNNPEALIYSVDYDLPIEHSLQLKNDSAALCRIERVSGDINAFSINYYSSASYDLNPQTNNFDMTGNWASALNHFKQNYTLFGISSNDTGVVRFVYSKSNPDVANQPLHVKKMGCPVPNGYQVVLETFTNTYNISDFSYKPEYFCATMPPMDRGVSKTFEWTSYQTLVNNNSVNVPLGETRSIFYVVKTSSVPTTFICDDGTFNPDNGKCEVIPSLIFVCNTGVFDSSLGLCVVTPSFENVCEKGRYDVDLGTCIFNPPVNNVCSVGVWNSSLNVCVVEPNLVFVCSEGTYDESTNTCLVELEARYIENVNVVYIGLFVVVVVIGGIVYFNKKRGKKK